MSTLVNMRMSIHQPGPLSPAVLRWACRLASRPGILGSAAALYTGSSILAAFLLQATPVVLVRGFDVSSLVPLVIGSWAGVSVLLIVLATLQRKGFLTPETLRARPPAPPVPFPE